jgi:hypothetical protein
VGARLATPATTATTKPGGRISAASVTPAALRQFGGTHWRLLWPWQYWRQAVSWFPKQCEMQTVLSLPLQYVTQARRLLPLQ